jgi:hypothetical protein
VNSRKDLPIKAEGFDVVLLDPGQGLFQHSGLTDLENKDVGELGGHHI